MRKRIIFICIIIVLGSLFVGCGTEVPNDVKALKEQLINFVDTNITTYFELEINPKDFDINLSEKTGENTFDYLKSIETTNEIYLIGHFNTKVKTVTDFIVIYDPVREEVVRFGVQTINDSGMRYADLK